MSTSPPAPSPNFVLRANGVSKAFGRRVICRGVDFRLQVGDSVAVVGPNGSGKSTFVKILAGLVRPDQGQVNHLAFDKPIPPNLWHRHQALVSPELSLYEELSGFENMEFTAEVLGLAQPRREHEALLDEVGLAGRGEDFVRAYSSGMKQRLKFALALLKSPAVLFLDEPTVTLDEDGAARVWAALERRKLALVIATNDTAEAARAKSHIRMGTTDA